MIAMAAQTAKKLDKVIHESSTAEKCWKLLKDIYTLLTSATYQTNSVGLIL